jgi:hypothetical protein
VEKNFCVPRQVVALTRSLARLCFAPQPLHTHAPLAAAPAGEGEEEGEDKGPRVGGDKASPPG